MNFRQRALHFIAIVGVLAGLSAGPQGVSAQPGPAPAAGFVVNVLTDAPDADLGNAVCETATPGQCTLRAALQQANASAGADAITFSVTGAIILTAELPSITDTVSLTGPGAALLAIDADEVGPVLQFAGFNPAGSFAVSGLTLTGGVDADGGGLILTGPTPLVISGTVISGNLAKTGGGLRLLGVATLINSLVRDNQATEQGGGIDNAGLLTVINSIIQENRQQTLVPAAPAEEGASGLNRGGGLFTSGPLTLTDSLVLSNTASATVISPLAQDLAPAAPTGPFGAGLYVDSTVALIRGSVIAGNHFVTCITCTVTAGSSSELGGGLVAVSSQVTIADTRIVSNTAGTYGGVASDAGFMSLTRVLVAGNIATTGGGIGSLGTLTVTDSIVRDNWAAAGNGGGLIIGGGSARITGSRIINNNAGGDGGGLFAVGADIYITGSQFEGNASGRFLPGDETSATQAEPQVASDAGGGLLLIGGLIEISDSAIVSNTATYGAGIHLAAWLTLRNSTLSGNAATRDGGGLLLALLPPLAAGQPGLVAGGPVTVSADLLHVTLAGNFADANNDATGQGGGLFVTTGTTATLHSTLVAANVDEGGEAPDCFGPVQSTGYNLVQSTLGCALSVAVAGDQRNVAGGVQPLHPNGGPTLTHALWFNSLALNAADPITCLPADQRGVLRPFGAGCDIGAYEAAGIYLPLVLR